MERWDAIVIGGGIAGVSAAAELAARSARVVVLERESQLAYHTTGRSAALYLENYGHPAIRPLSRASRTIFSSPPDGLTDGALFGEVRGALTVAEAGHEHELDEQLRSGAQAGTVVHRISVAEALDRVPVLRKELVVGALWEPDATDIDVAGTHQMYVRALRRAGAEIRTSTPVTGLDGGDGGWVVTSGTERFLGRMVVNAAGAWGDQVAALAGLKPVGLTPMRRTAFMVAGSADGADWPLVIGAGHDYYFKPDGSQLLCSPSEEEPDAPGDPRPREEDIALAIERINEVTTLAIRSVRSSWTGLRTFAPDRAMVIGPDPDAPSFHWLVGQGGTGIQTAPAAAMLMAGIALDGSPPDHLSHIDAPALSPGRFHFG